MRDESYTSGTPRPLNCWVILSFAALSWLLVYVLLTAALVLLRG